jgi:hypothetical protein
VRLFAVLVLAACSKHHEPGTIDREKARGLFEELLLDAPPGMSDLSIDDRGMLWSVAERERKVLEIELGKPPHVYPLEGVPGAVDTEAIAWLGGKQFAIGTEGTNEPSAAILFAELRDGRMLVTRMRSITHAELGVTLTKNHGIEALCGHDDELLAASETVGHLPDGTRYAPIVRLRGDQLSLTKLRLTSDRGKISALACAFDADGTADVIAIERHYGVARILRFKLARDTAETTATVDLDLHPVLRDALNLEGIVRMPDGRVVVINDNQGKSPRGPTQLLVFPPR